MKHQIEAEPGTVSSTLVLLMLLSFATACQLIEVVESHYDSYSELGESESMTRGWVPDDIPRNATDLSEAHDLDSNESWMKFRVDLDSPEAQDFFASWRTLAPEAVELIEAPMRLRWWDPPRDAEDLTFVLERADGPLRRCWILATKPETVYLSCGSSR